MTNDLISLDAHAHAACILEALDGDYELALEFMYVYEIYYGSEYAMELEKFLTPRGEA